MARAKDLGDQFPSDTGDALPPSVLLGRAEVDYNPPVDLASTESVIEAARATLGGFGSGGGTDREESVVDIVDLQDTQVTDNAHENQLDVPSTVFGSIFNLINSALHINKETYYYDAKNDLSARMLFRHHFDSYLDENGNGCWRPQALFPVFITYISGDDGTETSLASYLYHVQDLQGTTLSDSLENPIRAEKPIPLGHINRIDDETTGSGTAYLDDQELLRLWDAGETWGLSDNIPFMVRTLWVDDGSHGTDGTATSPATWLYDVYEKNGQNFGDLISTHVEVIKARPNGRMVQTFDHAPGLAYWSEDTLYLWDVSEYVLTETCP